MTKKLLSNLNFFLKSRWTLRPPKEKDILIYDGITNPFTKYFSSKFINILYVRKEEINLFILLKMLLNFKFSFKEYISSFVLYAKPKIILSAIDNDIKFYNLSKLLSIPTLFFQNGTRTHWNDVFSNKKIFKKNNKKKFKVVYMLVYNKEIGKKYSSFIEGKVVPVGSFKNNLLEGKINKRQQKRELLFISTNKTSKMKKISAADNKFYGNDYKVINFCYNFCVQNNLKFNVLGRQNLKFEQKEKEYFENSCKSKNINYIGKSKSKDAYFTVSKYKYIVSIDSSLGIECLSRGIRAAFLFNRPYRFPLNTRRYGWPVKMQRKGPHWTTFDDKKNLIEF